MRLPGNTRPGLWFWPVEPGTRCETELPCERVLAAEVVALDDAGEALADRHALHVDRLADLEDLDADLGADLQVGELVQPWRGIRCSTWPASTRRLGEVSGERLAHAARAALAERDLHGGIAVLLGGLDLRDAVVGHVEHRHRQRARRRR